CEHQADGSLADDQHAISGQDVETSNGFQDRVDRFNHRAFEKRIARGNSHNAGENKRHHADIFRVATASRFEPGGNSSFPVLGTLGERAMAAGVALHARHMMMESNTIADFESADTSAKFHNSAGSLVTENARWRDNAVKDFFNVGGADTTNGDFHEQLVGSDLRSWKSLKP